MGVACPHDKMMKEEESLEVKVHEDTANPTLAWDKIKVKSSTVCKMVEPMNPSTPKPKGMFANTVGFSNFGSKSP